MGSTKITAGNRHRHYDMIVAKAANTELVVFVKDANSWNEVTQVTPFYSDNTYFLCLPQHKEAVLNSLNGGVAQFESPREKGDHALEQADWSNSEWYMQGDATSRIKPKKEKRWIGVYGKHVTENHFGSKSEVEKHVDESPVYSNCAHNWWQFIEIEIEVTN